MIRILTTTFAALTLGAGVALAATWDTNDDGMVDAEEFAKGTISTATFHRFDDDNDGLVTFEEVGLTEPDEVFMAADNNGDGALAPGELTAATFMSYDVNRDEMLDEEEMSLFEYEEEVRSRPFAGDDATRSGRSVSK